VTQQDEANLHRCVVSRRADPQMQPLVPVAGTARFDARRD
jgi:hypothetical protein